MFYPEAMSKILILGHQQDLKSVIERLHELKIVHIVEHSKNELDIGTPLKEGEAASELLVRIRSLKTLLKIAEEPKKLPKDKLIFKKVKSNVDKIHALALKKTAKEKELNEKIALLERQYSTLSELAAFKLGLNLFYGYQNLAVFIGRVEKPELLKTKLKNITSEFELKIGKEFKKNIFTIALFIELSKKEQAENILQKFKFAPIDISPVKEMKGKPSDLIHEIERKLKECCTERDNVRNSLTGLSGKAKNFLVKEEARFSLIAEKAEAPLKFAVTSETFIVKGWVPKKQIEELRKELNILAKNRIVFEEMPTSDNEARPVRLKNPALVKPFEFFMELYSLPKYYEIDPSAILFITFPLFFGIMLGDIGYGLVSLILFTIFRKLFPGMKKLLNSMLLAALSAIIFGFVFGEFFGAEQIFGYELPVLIHRTHQINEMLIISVAIGIVQINLGLILGFINVLRHHGIKHAIFEKISWMVLEIGVGLLAVSYLKFLIIPVIVPSILILLAIVMLYLGEGVRGILELPTIFTNMLSYARLMALGLASASLAVVVNDMAGKFFNGNVVMIAVGVIILVFGHTINLLLGWLGPFLHSMRLQYVEFFTKFYEGGGYPYKPFGLNKSEGG
jgi:V/A-type H+-transporting ATPase subunit I